VSHERSEAYVKEAAELLPKVHRLGLVRIRVRVRIRIRV